MDIFKHICRWRLEKERQSWAVSPHSIFIPVPESSGAKQTLLCNPWSLRTKPGCIMLVAPHMPFYYKYVIALLKIWKNTSLIACQYEKEIKEINS